MLAPDAARDYAAVAARGDPRDFEAWADRFERYIGNRADRDRFPAMDIEGTSVSLIFTDSDGEESTRAKRMQQGFSVTAGRGVEFDGVPKDPVARGMLVVEIVMPMERKDARTGTYKEAIQGYHFAWNPGMKRWIPYESVVYKQTGDSFSAPPL